MKDALIARYNCPVLLVDWSVYSDNVNYGEAYCFVPKVANYLANYLANCLNANAFDVNGQHFIGHSLGAQLAGIIAYRFSQLTDFQMPWVTGLDPAGPGYYTSNCDSNNCTVSTDGSTNSLTNISAAFVDVIHTNIWAFGTPAISGKVDIFVDLCGFFQCECPTFNVTSPTQLQEGDVLSIGKL